MQNVSLIGIDLGKHSFHVMLRINTGMLYCVEHALPPYLARLLLQLRQHYIWLSEQIDEVEQELKNHLSDDESAKRLLTIPGAGVITASLLSIKLGDGKNVGSSRDSAALTGLVPRP